jgi:hypothetical protein
MTLKNMKLKTLSIASIAAAFFSTAAIAEDFVKPAPTPMPTAGPTVAAAQQFCGDPAGKAEELITRYTTQKGLKETYKSIDYVAYSDDEKNPTVMYTFTTKGHAAHPSIVCRKQVKDGEFLVMKMEVVCDSTKEACDKLRNDFNVVNAQVQTEVENKIKESGGK